MLTFKPPGVWSWFGLWKDHLLLQIVNSLTTWGLSPPRAGSQRTFPPAELSQRHPWPSSDVQPSKSQFHPAWKEEIWLQRKKIGLPEKNEFWRNKIDTCWRNCGWSCARFRIGLARCVCEYYMTQLQTKWCCFNDTVYEGANNSVSRCNLQSQADDKKLMPSNPMSASKPPLMWPRKWKF